MSNEIDPRGQGIDPENRSLARQDRPTEIDAVARNRDLAALGFTPLLPIRLRELNDVLVLLDPPQSFGFNIEMIPSRVDVSSPIIEFVRKVDHPSFKVEISGFEDGDAAVKINTTESVYGGYVKLDDIKHFARLAFPDRELEFRAEPRIEFKGRAFVRRTPGQVPKDLYEEYRDSTWREEKDEAIRKSSQRFLEGLLPTVNVDLYTVDEGQLDRLTEEMQGANVELTFYRKFDINPHKRKVARKESFLADVGRQLYNSFEIITKDNRHRILSFSVNNMSGSANCYFDNLQFFGKSEEVERVIEEFTKLMQKTPVYIRHSREQQRVNEEEGKSYGSRK